MTAPAGIAINGRFLAQKLSGVQRYSREITQALDRRIAEDPEGLGRHRWRLIVPPGATVDLPLQAIEVRQAGKRSGHLWEQIDLALAARDDRLVNLGNAGPLLHNDAIVVIHDAAPYRTPQNFGSRYGLFHRTLGRLLARRARLGTVSDFSRRELADVFGMDPARIFVANNGCDHLLGRAKDDSVVDRLGLTAGRYFLFVGTPTPNKNLTIAFDAFRRLGRSDAQLVVAGSLDPSIFGGTAPEALPGIVVAKGLLDAEIGGLYTHAAAHLFPSLYEGFGIPPLEAMACRCPVLAADIPVLREVCADAVTYFDPHDPAQLANLMASRLDTPQLTPPAHLAAARVAHFTWNRAAGQLASAILA